jgi:hypothetical protein
MRQTFKIPEPELVKCCVLKRGAAVEGRVLTSKVEIRPLMLPSIRLKWLDMWRTGLGSCA